MDAIHYDKIADKLVNFNSKLPQSVDLESSHAKTIVSDMKELIEHMLNEINLMARFDDMGWIR
jgi:hypothetical protein